jgi:hypothetical protein
MRFLADENVSSLRVFAYARCGGKLENPHELRALANHT